MTAPIVTHHTREIIPMPTGWAMSGYAERSMTYRAAGQLWEREAEREVTYYQANSYRYTNDLTTARSLLIGLRIMKGTAEEEPVNLSRHLLDQRYRTN